MSLPQDSTFISVCPGCGKKYRLAECLLGRPVKCKNCQTIWQAAHSVDQDVEDVSELTGTVANASSLAGPAGNGKSSSQNPNNQTANESSLDDDSSWVGKRLGRFQILDVLGKGAMGVVFLAHDPDLKRNVALKILARKFIRNQKKSYRLEQFVREARSAARLSHPNTVTVFEIGQDQGWFFIAMELVEGKTFLDLVKKRKKRIPLEQASELVAQAADALSAAHRLGIVHRDIKPSNLMLTADGRIKVADFGLAQLADTEDDFELPTKAVGTPYWMSPEQCKGQTAIPQSDIYSLGAVLYFALTGEVPYKGKTKREILSQHVNAPLPDPRNFRKEIPDALVRIIHRAMAKNPAERFHDAAEMAIGLRQIGGAMVQSKMAERWWGQLASTGAIADNHDKPKKAGWLSFAAISLVLTIVVGSMIFYYVKNSVSATKTDPVPPQNPSVQTTTLKKNQVHVFAIPGTRLYHAEGCLRLQDVPPDILIEYPSDEDAAAQGLVGCGYCQHLLQFQKERAATQPATTQK
jgi:serine/threonine protein kinase